MVGLAFWGVSEINSEATCKPEAGVAISAFQATERASKGFSKIGVTPIPLSKAQVSCLAS